MANRNPVVELTLARIREFLREPEILFWVFVFPVLLSVALGIAFRSRGAETVRIGILEGEGAEEVLGFLEANESIRPAILGPEEAERRLRNGDVAVLVIPGNPHTFRFDAARTESRFARMIADDAIQRGAGRSDPLSSRDEVVSQVGNRYIDFLIPGLLGLNLMGSGMWGIGFAVVQMRSKRLLKRFIATPMRKSDFLLSMIVSRFVFLIPEIAVIAGAGWLIFGVPIRGSLLAILVISIIGSLAFSGLGMLCASRVKTVEAISGLLNLVMMPMWVFCGALFSTKNFPDVMQPVIQFLPLTAVNDALRSVMLEGSSLASTFPDLLIAAFWGIAPFLVALKIFRWQ